MRKDIKRLIILLVSLVGIFALAHVLQSSSTKTRNNQNECKKINSIIAQEFNYAEKEIDNLAKQGEKEKLDSLVFYNYTQLFRKKQAGIFLYNESELIAWSTNRIPAPLQADSLQTNKNHIKLTDGYYMMHKINANKFSLVYLQNIYREYNYNNEYLNTGFNTLFNLNNNCEISLYETQNFVPITINGSKLFYVDSKSVETANYKLPAFAFLLALILFVILLIEASKFLIKNNVNQLLVLLALAIDMFILRLIMLKFSYPIAFYNLPIFSPEYYAESFWLPSPGDLGFNIILVFIWVLCFHRMFNTQTKQTSKLSNTLISVSAGIVVVVVQAFLSLRLSNIILNSSVELDPEKILSFSNYSLYLFAIILLFTLTSILLIDKLSKILHKHIKLIIFGFTLLATLTIWFFVANLEIRELIFPVIFLIIAFILFVIRQKQKSYNWYAYIVLIFFISLLLSDKLRYVISVKELSTRKVLASNLANERDAGAEFFLINTSNNIASDKHIENYIIKNDSKNLYNYLQKNYIKGYLSKYDLQISICKPIDSIFIHPDNELKHCYSFFSEMISKKGVPLIGSKFYFLEKHNGLISYFGYFKFLSDEQNETQLFIELNSKLFSEGLGYPELLLDKTYAPKKTMKNYSYAKYNNKKLIVKKGEYEYPYKYFFENNKSDFDIANLKDYSHLAYRPDSENIIIMSVEDKGIQRNLISLSYLFFICFALFGIYHISSNLLKKDYAYIRSLKNRIQFSILIIIIISILIIGAISINFIVKGYSDRHRQMIQDKLQSVTNEIELNIGHEIGSKNIDKELTNNLLIELSNVFYTDINLYNTKGSLLASSRTEIFDKGLQGRFMHPRALRLLGQNHTGMVIINERIGKVNYLSAYLPFRNDFNEITAYINLPYFSRQDELNTEINDFITAFANVFLLLIMLSIIMGIFIANQLTRPLAFLQEKIKSIDLGKRTEKIDYQRKDELGSLIREYNKKIDELAESAAKLAKSERESAWREMAKQIAHEIKNPLTPIKLSIQHLKLSYEPNKPEWEQTLNKVTQTIVEQIDTLTAIADEFSNFAKMPQANLKDIDLIEKIKSSMELFKPSCKNIKFNLNLEAPTQVIIRADSEQLTRVFNNLIKNSIQAIGEKQDAYINICLKEKEDHYLFSISDNGYGISEEMQSKIFTPNFTTKSSGMGLGLSMVKSIIDQMNGKIWFETKLNEGTTFFIEFLKL